MAEKRGRGRGRGRGKGKRKEAEEDGSGFFEFFEDIGEDIGDAILEIGESGAEEQMLLEATDANMITTIPEEDVFALELALISYEPPPRSEKLHEMFGEELYLIDETEEWFFAEGHTKCYLAFRGTNSVEDIFVDATVAATEYLGAQGLRFHSGFYHSVDEDEQLLNNLRNFSETESAGLDIVGHSLGGAKAILMLSQHTDIWGLNLNQAIRAVTFGAPPIFYKEWDEVGISQENLTSYVHNNDIVPRLNKIDFHIIPILAGLFGLDEALEDVISVYNQLVHGKGRVIWLKNDGEDEHQAGTDSYRGFILESDPKDESIFSREAILNIHDSFNGGMRDHKMENYKAAMLKLQSMF